MKNWKTSVYKFLGFLGTIGWLVLFIEWVAPHLNWAEMAFAVFFGFGALLSSFAFCRSMLPQEYRLIMPQSGKDLNR